MLSLRDTLHFIKMKEEELMHEEEVQEKFARVKTLHRCGCGCRSTREFMY